MGWYTCSRCGGGRTDSHDELNHGCCEYDVESFLCDRCYENIKTENCGKCKSDFCGDHGDFELTECCDQLLCEMCNEDDDGHGKTENTTTGDLTCNYYTDPGDCCACEQDNKKYHEDDLKRHDEPLAKNLLKNCKSDSLKGCLQSWLNTVPPENNSRKRDDVDSDVVDDDDDAADSTKSNNKKCKSDADADVEVIIID
jgi:hypothetical protein